MQRTTIDADDECSRAQKPDQLQKRSLVRQIHAILRCRKSSAGFADDNDAGGRQRAAKFQNHIGPDRFIASAGVGMENNESGKSIEARRLIPSWNRKTQIAQSRAKRLGQLEIAID